MNRIITTLFIIQTMIAFSCTNAAKENPQKEKAIIIKDASGFTIELDKPAERIVCLYEPALDALYMLHAEKRITGIFNDIYTSDELYPYYSKLDDRILQKQLSTPGSNGTANIEGITMLNPDLVIVQSAHEELGQALRSLGIPVYTTKVEQYAEVFKTVQDLATLTGTQERATELISYVKEEYAIMKKKADTLSSRKKAYFSWAYGRIFSTTGRNSMMHFCLEAAGVENVCKFDLDQPNISPETLMDWNPDLIIMWNDSPNEFYKKKELAEISAIKNKQIYNLLPMFFYNPHTLKSLNTAVSIHHWAYPNQEVKIRNTIEPIILKLYGEKGKKLIPLI